MAFWAALPAVASLVSGLTGKKQTGTENSGGTDWLGWAKLGTGLLGGISGSQMSQAELAERRRQFDAAQKQQQGQQALSATQMDPLAQQRSRQKMALIEQLMKGASSPTLNVSAGRFDGGMKYSPEMFKQIASYFTPEARGAAEGQFAGAANAASGGQYGTPNLAALGYGAAGDPTTAMPALPTTPLPGQDPDDRELLDPVERARRRFQTDVRTY